MCDNGERNLIFTLKKNWWKIFESFFFACNWKEIKLCEKKISNFIGVTCNVHNALYTPKFYVRKPNQTHRFHLKKKFDCYVKKYIENKKKTKNWLWESIKKNLINVRGTVENRTEKFYFLFFCYKSKKLALCEEKCFAFLNLILFL